MTLDLGARALDPRRARGGLRNTRVVLGGRLEWHCLEVGHGADGAALRAAVDDGEVAAAVAECGEQAVARGRRNRAEVAARRGVWFDHFVDAGDGVGGA